MRACIEDYPGLLLWLVVAVLMTLTTSVLLYVSLKRIVAARRELLFTVMRSKRKKDGSPYAWAASELEGVASLADVSVRAELYALALQDRVRVITTFVGKGSSPFAQEEADSEGRVRLFEAASRSGE